MKSSRSKTKHGTRSKILMAFLCAALAFSATACGGKGDASKDTQADPKEIYEAAIKKNAELKSLDMTTAMTMDIKAGEETVKMEMTMDMKMSGEDPDNLQYYSKSSTSSGGESADILMFYQDGYLYMDSMGQKIKYAVPVEEMKEQAEANISKEDISVEWLKELTMEESGDKKVLNYTGDPEKMKPYIEGVLASQGNTVEGMEFTINEVSGQYIINKDGYYESMDLSIDMEMTMQGQAANVKLVMDTEINNPGGEVSVELPSTDGYEEVDASAMAPAS